MKRLGVLVVVALAAAVAGCPQKPPVVRPYPPPTAAELAAALRAQQAAVHTLNARVRATSWLGGDRVRATVLLLATRAGDLRFEAEVTLQGTVAILVTSGGRFAMLETSKNELRRGPACPANVAQLVHIPLSPAEVAAILMGDVDLGPIAEPPVEGEGAVTWDPAAGADVWTVAARGGFARLAFTGDPAHRALAGVTFQDPGGRRLWRTSYEDFDTEGGVRLPREIRFAEGDQSFDDGVDVHFKDRTLNEPHKPSDFEITPPPGAAIHDVGCPR
jgi:hypothetical protein